MGKKRPLKFVYVGEGSSHSRQRREEELEAAPTTEQARADASADGTQPPGSCICLQIAFHIYYESHNFPVVGCSNDKNRGLTVVEVAKGNGHSRESVQEELEAAFTADQARGDASDDDETQPPDDPIVQETPASNNLRNKRGDTLLRRIWSLPPNMKIECELNARGQPVGDSGKTFKRWLGTCCLSYVLCPLVPIAWTRVPNNHKADCWIEIEKRWIFDPEIIQPADQMIWAMHQLGELRRNRRSKLKKKYYKEDASKQEIIRSRPTWAEEQQFTQLVDYWFHEDTQTLSNTNKVSRSKQKEIARSGPISFAQTADDMAKETGQAVERAVLFAKVYSTKDGHPITPEVGEKIRQMTEILTRGSSLQGSRREGILWSKDDAFAQVMGAERSGRVRGVGFGPTPSGRSGSNRSCYALTPPPSISTTQRINELETSHHTLRDELAQVEQRHREQIALLQAQHKAELASAIAQSEAKHQEQMLEMTNQMGELLRQLRPLISSSQLNSQGSTTSK